jgi:hypothetical protein
VAVIYIPVSGCLFLLTNAELLKQPLARSG